MRAKLIMFSIMTACTLGSCESILEIDPISEITMANYWKSVLVIGTGNEGSARGHTSGQLVMGREQEVEFAVGEYEPALSLQIWKSYADIFSIRMTHPSGKTVFEL